MAFKTSRVSLGAVVAAPGSGSMVTTRIAIGVVVDTDPPAVNRPNRNFMNFVP